ncbi:hypothetical protein LTR05_002275 [Lithohypha guttulata]|uniref:Uncharacterized protein n=1 Tax=Lithohypha guttulata TaxID=1690604 RepID=A0AAN7T361_9EURO|nr:hypothetical protein LTR05_002275 [Lithohypha guttulata]
MHNFKRAEPSTLPATLRPGETSVIAPGATDILTDGGRPQSALTTILQSFEQPITQPATTLTSTGLRTVYVTDSASYSLLRASESSERARETHSDTSASTSSSPTSKATSSSSSSSTNNLGTLIPAVVVPVAIVLIVSFVVFWFIMRRRAQRQLKEEPEFVVASKSEKTAISRGPSNGSSTGSTRELVPLSNLEKEVAVTTTSEMRKPSIDLFPPSPPKYSSIDIGLARPMTPPDKAGAHVNSTGRPVHNFSRGQSQNRGQKSTKSRNDRAPRPGERTTPLETGRGPSTTMPGQLPRPPYSGTTSEHYGGRSPPKTTPSPLVTNMKKNNRALAPQPLNPPTPTGAFNGASPISQYSPIVKDHPNLGAVAAADSAEIPGQPPPISTANFFPSGQEKDSPIDENVLSLENMRVARLANSSRLGLHHSPIQSNFPANSRREPGADATKRVHPSPQLSMPLTREELPFRPFARGPDSPAGGSSIYPSPSIGADNTPRIGGGASSYSLPQSEHTIGVASSRAYHNRVSVVSRLSSDDGYVDVEFDTKSDVSSLDERDKWETGGERQEPGYHAPAHGSAGLSPVGQASSSSTETSNHKPNLRDRDSEGPFVLSRY